MRRSARGFTLIELMIVVSIIGILAAVAIPKFANLLRKAKEGATKGKLGGLRSALSIYYGENEGNYPTGAWNSNSAVLQDALVPKYIGEIPLIEIPPYHNASRNVFCHQDISGHNHDGYGWIYDCAPPGYGTATRGTLWVACSHTDAKASLWTAY